MSKTRDKRIATLRAIIEKTNHEGERSNAARALQRLLDGKAKETGGESGRDLYRRWYGDKYHLITGKNLTEIAAMVRADISLSRKMAKKHPAQPGEVAVIDPIGDAPAQVKITVRREYYAGGGSIDIFVRNIPEEWGWTTKSDRWGDRRRAPSDALETLAAELKKILNSYNHNGSRPEIDYFDVRFYGHVMNEGGLILA